MSLQSIALPEGVLSVEDGTFSNCMRLERVTLGGAAFADCAALARIELPAHLRELKRDTFAGCTALTAITLPDGAENNNLGNLPSVSN